MRSLFWKEFRQGRPLLIFGAIVALLLAAAYATIARLYPQELAMDDYLVLGGPSPINLTLAIIALAAPVLISLFAGAGLFAGEADHNTVPVLFALPLSRRRIWLAKVLAGLALTAVGSTILLALDRLLMPAAYRSLPISAYLPDLCLLVIFVYALAVFMSALTSYVVAAFVGALLVGGAILTGVILMYGQLGALLLGYNPFLDLALWLFLFSPSLLIGSALAITRGELLLSLRKHAFGIPALVLGLLVTLLLVVGVARVATRYSRGRVQAIDAGPGSPRSSLLAIIARGDPVPYQRVDIGRGWARRPYHWERGQYGDIVDGPLYRSNHGVIIDLKTGREELRLRSAFDNRAFQMAVSPDGRLAAVTNGPAGLTWGTQSWRYFPERLEIFDLVHHRRLFSDFPAPLVKRDGIPVGDLKWSHSGDYLAFTIIYSGGPSPSVAGFYAMKPDGSEVRDLAIRPGYDSWVWSPTENVIYALDRGRLYRVYPDGRAPRAVWTPEPAADGRQRSLPQSSFSPDGRWLVLLEAWDANPVSSTGSRPVTLTAACLRAVRADGEESHLLGSWWPLPQRLHQPGEPDRMVGSVRVRVAWGGDPSTLYALISVDNRRSHLFRWRPGSDPSLVLFAPALPYPVASLAARPNSNEVLVWPYPGWRQRAQHGPILVGPDGRSRPIPTAATSIRFADENRFVSFDDTGRLITIAGPPDRQTIRATDLTTGQGERLYP